MIKNRPKILGTTAIFKKLPEVNNYPVGKNSLNLVTLPLSLLFTNVTMGKNAFFKVPNWLLVFIINSNVRVGSC
jgi:hypothetical protein